MSSNDKTLAALAQSWEKEAGEFDTATTALVKALRRDAAPYLAVLGSAREEAKAPLLHSLYGFLGTEVGTAIADSGYSLITGGCPGIVEVAQAAFVASRIDSVRQRSVGVRIGNLGFVEPPNPHLETMVMAPEFGTRLRLLCETPSAYIVLPGGYGSLLEIGYFLQHIQAVKGFRDRPIFLIGDCWVGMRDLAAELVELGTIDETDRDLIHVITSPSDVATLIRGLHFEGRILRPAT